MKTLSHQALGRYQIESEIGRGAMGVVYRARDPKIDRVVAIKTISLSLASSALGTQFATGQDVPDENAYRRRFVQEARAAGRLSHPGIVTIFDVGEDPETREPYLVMEHIAGEPLSRVLSRGDRRLPLPITLQLAQEVAEALDYAHAQGVVHRDIKPSNILLTEDGHAKIADFGVAWLSQEATQNGEVVGSPAFMAPEQMAGKPADARSDLFSLGVVLYSMLTGFRPFQGNSAKTVVFKVMNIEPVPVTSFQSNVPPALDAIISRAIAKDPDDRYQSGAEMAREIEAFRKADWAPSETTTRFQILSSDSVTANSGATKNKRKQRKNHGFLVAGAVIAVLCGGLVFAWHMERAHNASLQAEVAAEIRSHTAPPQLPAITQTSAILAKRLPHKPRVQKKTPAPPQNAPPAPPVVESAKVEVEIQHHFNGAKASIWLDDDLVFDQDLRGTAEQRHTFLRTVEVDQVTVFHFAPGKHWLQVRIVSRSNAYDQIETLEADLAPDSKHLLLVNCDKRKMQVNLQ